MVEADGLLKLPYIGILWAFSPAYPPWLASVIPQKDYWGVVQVWHTHNHTRNHTRNHTHNYPPHTVH